MHHGLKGYALQEKESRKARRRRKKKCIKELSWLWNFSLHSLSNYNADVDGDWIKKVHKKSQISLSKLVWADDLSLNPHCAFLWVSWEKLNWIGQFHKAINLFSCGEISSQFFSFLCSLKKQIGHLYVQ